MGALHADLQWRVAELEWLRDISRRITEARTRAEVLDVVYRGIREGLRYDRAGINLFDHEAGVFEDCIGTDATGAMVRPMDRTVGLAPESAIWLFPGIAALLRGAEFYYTPDAGAECPPDLRFLFDGVPTHNLMVPLRSAGRVSGMISVDNLLSGRPISPHDAGPLLALANQVATAVENARLHERERAERARLALMATTDALTGLPNRTLLLDRLGREIAAAQCTQGHLALLLIDLDRFKEVNDSFVQHMLDEETDDTIVASTIALGHNLGLRVVAEGVEDARTWQRLAELGCDVVQGYYVSRPLPAEDWDHWLHQAPWAAA